MHGDDVTNVWDTGSLTREQVAAIERLEGEFVNMRGRVVDVDTIENVLHAFICHGMGECVCRTMRPVSS